MRKVGRDRSTAEPLRVLHVLEATLGGTRRYIEDLAAATSKMPVKMALAYSTLRADSNFKMALERVQEAGWATYDVPMVRGLSLFRDLGGIAALMVTMRRFRPNVVHCHSAKAGGLGRLAACLTRPRPLVYYSPHALPVAIGGPYMRLERILARITDRFIAVSGSEGDQIAASGIGARQIDIVSPAIDCTYWSPRDRNDARQRLDIDPSSLVIVGVGRLTAQKDPLTFVRMISVMKSSHPGTHGMWVGDGELRGQLEQEIQRLGLRDDFNVVGWQEDVRPYIAAANIIVSTARYESFGYAVPEAMAMGRAVVGTDITGTTDIIPQVDPYLLFSAGHPEDAARKVAAVIEVPGKADELGILGRRFVETEFSIDRMASRLAVLYQLAGG